MSISLQTNVSSLIAQNNLNSNQKFQANTIQQLTSGYRINSSGDDAAGLAVANKFRSDTAELTQGVHNANDGLGTLQIIDGGLNNISQLLNRLKTLATQSASTTFTGDRNTLNVEYQQDVKEITRQASNIGLNGGGTYNTLNTVYIGGGSSTANAQVNIDLSGTQNAVDASGLGVASTSVAAGGTGLTGNTTRLDAPGATFLAAAAQTFTFNLFSNNQASSVTVSVGGTGALTSDQVISSLNGSLSSYGISASIGSGGQLQFGGATPFTVTTATTAADKIATTASTAINGGNYETAGAATYAGAAENLTFQSGQGTATVALLATDNLTSALTKINQATSSIGIYAVKNAAGTGIDFQSASTFSASTDTATATFTAVGAQTVNAPANTGSSTGNAIGAIASIDHAILTLGDTQGRVGAGENKLQYAINLATSQITNYSAAESQIRDADVAAQAANLTKAQVLQQASVAALAQANSAPQAVLALLKG
jgi:flagellin